MESELLYIARQRERSSIFEVEGTPDTFWVVRFAGSEGLSELFEFEVEVAARHVDFSSLVGRYARLKIAELSEPRIVHGMILRVEYAGELRPRGLYRFTLVPATYRLLLRSNCRIFQNLDVSEIVTRVLAEAGVPKPWCRFKLERPRRKREYCVQYRESDLAFVHRLLEDEGIFYYFEHDERRHVMVLTDRSGGGPSIAGEPGLPYREPGGMAPDHEHVSRFRLSQELRPAMATVRGFDLGSPESPVVLEKKAAPAGPELYDYAGDLKRGAEPPLADREVEAAQATRRRGRGTSDCPRLLPGFLFSLSHHPLQEFDGEYAVVRVHHTGEQPDTIDATADQALVYRNEFVCIAGDLPYRAPRVTPRPAVHGVQTATVIAPPGETVHVDEFGRVKLQFHWDRRDGFDERSSCWVPVSQLWAGNGMGAMFIPRVGHEVIVEFIEGDPDRPVVTGRLYHGMNASPIALPDHKSRSTIRSETLAGGGYNELRFEDRPDNEQVFLHAQRDMDVCVLRERREAVGVDEHRIVGERQLEKTAERHTTITGKHVGKVGQIQLSSGQVDAELSGDARLATSGAAHLTIAGSQFVGVGADSHTKVAGNVLHEAGGVVHLKAAVVVIEAAAGITLQGPGGFITLDAAGVSIQGGQILLNSGGSALSGPGSPTAPQAPTVTTPTEPTRAEGEN